MSRPRSVSSSTFTVSVKLNKAGVTALDQLRGDVARSAYMRGLLRQAAKNRNQEQR